MNKTLTWVMKTKVKSVRTRKYFRFEIKLSTGCIKIWLSVPFDHFYYCRCRTIISKFNVIHVICSAVSKRFSKRLWNANLFYTLNISLIPLILRWTTLNFSLTTLNAVYRKGKDHKAFSLRSSILWISRLWLRDLN